MTIQQMIEPKLVIAEKRKILIDDSYEMNYSSAQTQNVQATIFAIVQVVVA